MKKKFSLVLIAVLLVLVMATCVACGDGPDDGGETPDPAPQGFTVTLDLQNGTEPTTQIVQPGGTVVFPTVEDETYRTFRGWYKDAEGKSPWLKTSKIEADVTIYAGWKQLFGKVTYNFNYDGAPKATVENMPLGQVLVHPENPTRECWTFLGWYTDKAGTTAYDNDAVFTEAVTLYAKWELEAGHVHEYTTVNTPMTCISNGYDTNTCACGDTYTSNEIPASGHSFTYSDTDYFGMVLCENDDCAAAQRKASERIYEDKFVYTFDEAKAAEIDQLYADMIALLESADRYDATLHAYAKPSDLWDENKAFETNYFDKFYDELMYLTEQYQYAYVFYCVSSSPENTEAYEYISEYRTNAVSDFYALYRLVYETEFREFFFDKVEGGWTDEDIAEALILSDSYGGDEYSEINNRISEIEVEFREIEDPTVGNEMLGLYEEFVKLQNQLAELAGYNSYVDYAYPNVYNRDYSPEEAKTMRNYVKTYLKPVFTNLYNGYVLTYGKTFEDGSDAKAAVDALSNDSIFNSKLGTDLVKGYFEQMTSTTAGDKEIDFYKHANDLFKNGNYYTGTYSGAFSYWIGAQDTSILYFGPSSYSSAFTFVHEFGHYYNGVYNGGIGLSYDLDEIHSQANEMLFLAYLENALPKEVLREMYSKVYYDNLFNMFAIVMLATAVDEFEYCVYNQLNLDGTPHTDSNGNPAPYSADEYDSLFKGAMSAFGISGVLNASYWRYVVIESPGYYISYAMSALPCVELLSIAETQGFETAKDIYFKFFTFTDDPNNVEIDDVGDKVVKIGYGDTLKYAGLHSVFDEAMYTTIKAYFVDTNKDFSYPDAE